MNFKDTEIGRIPFEWDVRMIQDVAEVVSGATPKTKVAEYWDGNIAWITPKDLSNHTERYIYRGDRMITDEGLKNSSAKLLPKGSVLFSSRAPIGYTAIAAQELCTNQGFKSMICNQQILDNNFMFYMMNYKKNEIENIAGGSTFKEVSGKTVKEFKIPIPPLDEQKAIAKVLSDLDEKIETNNKINKKLEEMAQAIFKQWFVDFEFPNEDGKPYKSSGGEMVESELGMIPKGWEVDSLSNLVKEVITGKTPSTKKSENYGDKYPFVTIPDMHNKVFVTKTERYLSEDGHKLQEKKLIPKNSIMVSCIATVGLVSISSEAVHTNQQINSIIPNSIEEVFYFYEYLKLMEDRLKRIGSAGSATLNVNKGEFEKIKYIYPNSRIINKYNNTVKNIYEKIKLNEIENNRLAQLRDTLLPKLMSGEIRVQID